MVLPDSDHECSLLPFLQQLAERLEKVEHENAQLKKSLYGAKSERSKMPSVTTGERATPEQAKATRRARAEAKAQTPTLRIEHKVPGALRRCTACGRTDLTPMGPGKSTFVWEFVPAKFVRHEHVQEVLRCRCGGCVVTAPGAPKVVEKGQYGPGFIAHLVVQKCGDSLPIYRIEKQFKRLGIPMSRSTMTELFHRAGELLKPLAARVLALVAASDVVLADETSMPMQKTVRLEKKPKRSYLWTFVSGNFVAYRFSSSRSGTTPREVLGGTTGTLVVDAYTGYNAVTGVDGRTRAGCLAHARRKFFDAVGAHPEAQIALDAIRDVYRVEHEAKERGVARTPEHLAMRTARSKPILDKLHDWLVEKKDAFLPKGGMGTAIRYALDNWAELTVFLADVHVPPDNNRSEAALRVAALGRKNYLLSLIHI